MLLNIKNEEILIKSIIFRHGYPGKSCLLRTICEAAEFTFQHEGVLNDILHIVLT